MKRSIVPVFFAIILTIFTFAADSAPAITAVIQKYEGENVVEILALKGAENDFGVELFNNFVDFIVGDFYRKYEKNKDSDSWVDIRSYPFTSDDWLQIVTTLNEFPIYGTDGEIVSFNYDRKNKRYLTMVDMMALQGFDIKTLEAKVKQHFIPGYPGQTIDNVKGKGFLVMPGGDVLILIEADVDTPGADEWTYFFAYSLNDDQDDDGIPNPLTRLNNKRRLFGGNLVDKMNPPLKCNEETGE